MKKEKTVKIRRIKTRAQVVFDYVLFLGPSLVLFITLFIIPLIGEFAYSFTDWNGVDPMSNFVGLRNYMRAFKDATYWTSLWFTIKFSFFVILFSNLLATKRYVFGEDVGPNKRK